MYTDISTVYQLGDLGPISCDGGVSECQWGRQLKISGALAAGGCSKVQTFNVQASSFKLQVLMFFHPVSGLRPHILVSVGLYIRQSP